MPSDDTPTQRPGLANQPFGSGYAAFGCTVNRISVDELFAKYEACGFLYPAKRDRLRPYMPLIADNWHRSMSAPTDAFLHDVITYEHSDAWASVTYWATSNGSVHSQHLVSGGRPEGSRAVLLSAQSGSRGYQHSASQNWFRTENRYPARVFGSCTLSLGPENATVQRHALLSIDRAQLPQPDATIRVQAASDADASALASLARQLCGAVQAQADEWAAGDVELASLDRRYRAVGLRRFRRVFVATAPGSLEPIGMAVAYRGPLGLNFSFLENRCELWLDPQMDNELHAQTISALVCAAAPTYDDFELPCMLVTTDSFAARILIQRGAQPVQEYSRSVWLRAGYAAWYNHVNGFYARVIAAAHRRIGSEINGVPS